MTPERMRRAQLATRLSDVQNTKRSDLSFLTEQRVDKYLRSARPLDAVEGWTHIGAAVRNIMAEIE